jgi:hypothetical protein
VSLISADLINFNHVFEPGGAGTGELAIAGDYLQTVSGRFVIDVAGAADHDRLTVAGEASLHGTFEVTLADGYVPPSGSQFTVLSAASIVDNGLALGGPDADWFTMDLSSGTSVVLNTKMFGDYNDDGTIDAADYVVWRDNFGQTAGSASASSASATPTAPEPVTR